MIIAGPTQAGKTHLTKNLIIRRNEIISPPIEKVVYCYAEELPEVFDELSHHVPDIAFHKGLPEDYGDEDRTPHLYILDDLMLEASKCKDVLTTFIRGSHHKNCSVIMLVQNPYHDGLCTLSRNCKYKIFFKNPTDTTSIKIQGQNMNGGYKNKYVEESFKDAVSVPRGYLLIDLSQEQDDNVRLRNNIFPDDECIVYMKK
jgi:hypothetical protein